MHVVSELLETCPLTGLSFSPTLQSIQEKREDEEQKSFRLSDSWNERAALVVLRLGSCVADHRAITTSYWSCFFNFIMSFSN